MTSQVINTAVSIFLPYFTPVIFVILSVVIADHLRSTLTSAFVETAYGNKRRST